LPKKTIDQQLQELDAWLASGGFTRAKNPRGALERARSQRTSDAQATRVAVAAEKQAARRKGIEVIQAGWQWPWLLHGFSTRTGGVSKTFGRNDLNLGGSQDTHDNIARNRDLFVSQFFPTGNGGKAKAHLVTIKQIHSATVHIVNDVPEHRLVGDGMITLVPGLLLAVQVADCVPVLVVDPANRAVGAFHAGWRGTVKRIVEKGIGMMRMAYGSNPADLHAAIGPCVGQCCYRVGSEVADEFRSQFEYAHQLFNNVFDDDPVKKKYPLLFLTARAPGHSDLGPQIHLDLVEANRRQLIAAGMKPENIWSSGLCTSCNTDRLFSHRAEHGSTGRMMGVIGVRAI
jgi:YfiH family protein